MFYKNKFMQILIASIVSVKWKYLMHTRFAFLWRVRIYLFLFPYDEVNVYVCLRCGKM